MAENNDFIITMEDISTMPIARCRRGLCAGGMRKFCTKHGYSYEKFLAEGVPASKLESIHDAMMHRVVRHARKRRGLD